MGVGVHAAAPTTSLGGAVTTPGRTTTSGATILAFCTQSGGAFGATPMQDSNANTWVQVGSDITFNGASQSLRIYKAVNITGGVGHTFTCTPNASAFAALFIQEVTGGGAAPTVLSSGNSDATTPYATTTGVSPAGTCTIVGCIISDAPSGTEADTWGGSFASGDKTEAITDANNSITGSMAAVTKAAGTYTSSVTISGVTVTDTGVVIVSVEGGSQIVSAGASFDAQSTFMGIGQPDLGAALQAIAYAAASKSDIQARSAETHAHGPLSAAKGEIAARAAALLAHSSLNALGSFVKFSFVLYQTDGETPKANWTGLNVVWWPSLSAMLSGNTPAIIAIGKSTDGSGLFELTAPASLSPGDDQGFGIIFDQDMVPDDAESMWSGCFDVTEA